MSAPTRRQSAGSDSDLLVKWGFATLGVLVAVAAVVWAAVRVADRVQGTTQAVGRNPFALLLAVASGAVAWSTPATLAAAGLVVAIAAAGASVWRAGARRRRRRTRVDVAARHLAPRSALGRLTRAGVSATAARLGAPLDPPGLPIGLALPGRVEVWQSWEDVAIDVWGARSGKTTGRAIPMILAAPGAVVATSNKRDIVDATRDPRAQHAGEPPWVFDPQGLVDEPATWFWNPLSYVVDEVRAASLAGVFADATRSSTSRTDAYFDGAGRELLAGLLLAAARAGRPITDVYRWLVDANDETAVRLLVDSGDDLVAAGVRDAMRAPDKQRAGVYGTAKQMVGWLTNRAVVRWAVGGEGRREFSPEAFVTSRGTLYSLSKEGFGSAGPLVTALTVAVTEAAEQHASRQAGGRLRVPLVVVLDEAANVCRWGQLPNMYSHYGSRGICVDTLLQSWSQGVEVWGREGMNKLWGAATVRVVGPGVAEADFLDQVSRLGGDFERVTRSTSSGRGGASTSRQTVKERILDPADLAAMPAGRAVVLASGVPPMLIETQPWMSGPHAAAVRASLLRHEPGRTS